MGKFRAGDRVRLVDSGGWLTLKGREGHSFTVSRSWRSGDTDFVQLEELLKEYPSHNRREENFELVLPGNGAGYNDKPKPIGRKDDAGKLDMTLLDDMPRAIKAVVEVMQWANVEKKPVPYERGSWLGVSADRYRAAIARHNRDACQQAAVDQMVTGTGAVRFQRDGETGKLHLAHIAVSALMALELVCREEEKL